MAFGINGHKVAPPLLTIGKSLYNTSGELNITTTGTYTPVGILDGIGTYELDSDTVRIFVNHELRNSFGYHYEVNDGNGSAFALEDARIFYFHIDKLSKDITDGGIAYDTIYDANGEVAQDLSFLQDGFLGFSRFCSSVLIAAGEFGKYLWRKKGLDFWFTLSLEI